MRVTFLPSGLTVEAAAGDTLLDAGLDHGVEIEHDCGGNCACTTCRVEVVSGAEALSPMEEVESDMLSSAENVTPATRLSCQALLVGGDVTVRVRETE